MTILDWLQLIISLVFRGVVLFLERYLENWGGGGVVFYFSCENESCSVMSDSL